VRRGLNPKLGGGGLHHVAVEAADFEASLRFYVDGLGFAERLRFPEETPAGTRTVAFLDAGDGTYVELFSPTRAGPERAGGPTPGGAAGRGPALFHFALRVTDCDAATARAIAAGASLEEGPEDAVLAGDPPVPCRYCFVRGPSGESVELIAVEAL
jgi:glyoxylase I family protein